MLVAEGKGTLISGIIFDAGTNNSPVLLQVEAAANILAAAMAQRCRL